MTDWQTPPELFQPINEMIGGFKVDAAANTANHLTPLWYGPDSILGVGSEDALSIPVWLSPAWCNPPYGKGIERWLDHFILQVKHGGTVVALLPARVETKWWFEKVVPWADILFLVGRVPFKDPNRTEPSQPDHASALCLFEPEASGKVGWLEWKDKFVASEVVYE